MVYKGLNDLAPDYINDLFIKTSEVHTRNLQSNENAQLRVPESRNNMFEIIIKSLDPLRAKKTFIRKKLGHTAVLAIKASSVTLEIWQKELEDNAVNLQI